MSNDSAYSSNHTLFLYYVDRHDEQWKYRFALKQEHLYDWDTNKPSFGQRVQYPMERHPGALLERSKPHDNNPQCLGMMYKEELITYKMWD